MNIVEYAIQWRSMGFSNQDDAPQNIVAKMAEDIFKEGLRIGIELYRKEGK